jgi:hypothetical protein
VRAKERAGVEVESDVILVACCLQSERFVGGKKLTVQYINQAGT